MHLVYSESHLHDNHMRRLGERLGYLRQAQAQDDFGALAWRAGEGDLASMSADDFADDR